MTEKEIKIKIINYLSKKGLNVMLDKYGDDIVWNYNILYSEFNTRLSFYSKKLYSENEKDFYIDYYSNAHKLKKTVLSGNYCLRIYKKLLIIKEELDKIAEKNKNFIDTKNKYCTELESYFKSKHQSVDISTYIETNSISIIINCYDPNVRTYYRIRYMNNKYYLLLKTEEIEKKLEVNLE